MTTQNYFKVKNGLEAPSQTAIDVTVNNVPAVRPSLLLDFASTKSLTQKVAFSRGSTGTYYDGKTTVLAEQNLLTYSQDFTNGWTKVSATVTANSTTAPDGTTTASTITSSGTSYGAVKQTISSSPGTTYTASIYILKTSSAITYYPCFVFRKNSSGTQICGVYIDTTNGTLTLNTDAAASAPISYGITSAGNYWRVYVTGTSTDTGPAVDFYPALSANGSTSSSGLVGSQVIWGAQLEQRSQVTAYTATTTTPITNYIPVLQTAASGSPRFDCDPVTGESKGLLVESSATNLLTYSSDFENAIWGKVNTTVQAKCIVAPDGTLTGTKIVENNVNGIHLLYLPYTWTANTYTYTIYVKPISRYSIGIGPGSTSIWAASATYDLQAVTANASYGSASISVVGNGWYRLSLTGVATAGTTNLNALILQSGALVSYTGDGYSGIYVWGAQLELGSFATSYISTPMTYSGRGSTGTYLGSNGYVQTAPANVARYQPNAAGGSNILLEGASSNLLNWANDFSSARWGAVSTNTPIVQNNIGIAPDGTFTASSITFTGTNTWWGRSYGFVTGNTYTFSLWVKVSDGLGTLTDLSLTFYSTGGGVQQHVTGFTITNSWQLITATFSSVVNGTGTSHAVIRSNSTRQINVWGSQLEQASSGSSLIPSIESFTSRASTGTYYDISTTALAEQNLLTYSDQFDNAAWLRSGSPSPIVTANATIAPDGTLTAEKYVGGSSATYAELRQVATLINNTSYVCSVYAKAAERSEIQFNTQIGGTSVAVVFDLTLGIVTSGVGTIQSVGNGWYRCIQSFTSNGTTGIVRVNQSPGSTAFDGTSGVYIWGAQLEQRSSVTAYTPTTTAAITNYIPVMKTAPSNIARYDYDPVTRLSKGLLVEPAATNLLTYSSGFSNYWTKTNSGVASINAIGPDGNISASTLVSNNGSQTVAVSPGIPITAGQSYTASVFLKSYNKSNIVLQFAGNFVPFARGATFNLLNGTISNIGEGIIAYMYSVGNGWWRCCMTVTSAAITGSAPFWIYLDTPFGYYFYGAQLEEGSVATSYIPTTSAQVTRAADVATSTAQSRAADVYSSSQVTRAADSVYTTDVSWLNPNEGTFLVDRKTLGIKANQTLLSLDNGTTDIESKLISVPNSRNLLTYTEQFDNAAWTKLNMTVTPNQAIAPDGALSADLIASTSATVRLKQSFTGLVAGTQYVFSCYFKQNTNTTINVLITNSGETANSLLTYTLSSNSYTASNFGGTYINSYVTTPIGSGWYKMTIGCSIPASQTTLQVNVGYPENGTSMYVWGAQLEQGSTVSSYEPNPLYLNTVEVGADGLAYGDNTSSTLALGYASNDAVVSTTNPTFASVNIQSSTAGTRATINKTSGTVDLKVANIKDITATGGATYTASKSNYSYDRGNNFGITFQ